MYLPSLYIFLLLVYDAILCTYIFELKPVL